MANGKATNSADEEQVAAGQDEGDATTDPEVPALSVASEPESISVALPRVGQSVLYVTSSGDALAGLVQMVWDDDTIDVQVDGPDRHFAVSQVLHDATKQPDTWHWPEQG